MDIYLLKVNIDGFGGKLNDRYFYSFDSAFEALKNTSGFFYIESKDWWDIEGTRETRVEMSEDKSSLFLRGIVYPEKERDEYSLRWAEASIERITVDGNPKDNNLYVLVKEFGYNSYLYDAFEPRIMPNDYDPIYTRFTPYLRTFSKNYVKKYARSHVKNLPRIWNDKKDREKINPMSGHGSDYLAIKEYKIS